MAPPDVSFLGVATRTLPLQLEVILAFNVIFLISVCAYVAWSLYGDLDQLHSRHRRLSPREGEYKDGDEVGELPVFAGQSRGGGTNGGGANGGGGSSRALAARFERPPAMQTFNSLEAGPFQTALSDRLSAKKKAQIASYRMKAPQPGLLSGVFSQRSSSGYTELVDSAYSAKPPSSRTSCLASDNERSVRRNPAVMALFSTELMHSNR